MLKANADTFIYCMDDFFAFIYEPSMQSIEEYLRKVKECADASRFFVSDRPKNHSFIAEFSIGQQDIKQILSSLTVHDFSKCEPNRSKHVCNKGELVYIFGKELQLRDIDGEEHIVKTYIKLKVMAKQSRDFCIVISLHHTSNLPKPMF